MKAESTLNKVKVLLGMEIKLEEMKLENGTRFEADGKAYQKPRRCNC